jgi:signal peptidase I
MAVADDTKFVPSPWSTVWNHPGDTIVGVLAAKPRLFPSLALLMAAGVAMSFLSVQIGDRIAVPVLDWRFLAVGAAASLVIGIVTLYLYVFCMALAGWMLGGRASLGAMCAVIAWGVAPLCAALVIYLLILFGGSVNSQTPFAPPAGLSYIGEVMCLWSIVITVVMLRRAQAFGWWRAIFTYALGGAILVLLIALPIRIFLFQPFNMPSGSMKPTLLVGDDFFVAKYVYGYSRFSLPFSPPLFTGRLFAVEPRRGDLVVFRLPKGPAIDYVKRLVGLPGDRIQMKGGVLHINGAAVTRERIADYIDDENGRAEKVQRFRETLPDGVTYETLDLQDNGSLDNTQEYVVPAGHYFMIGDNRDNSADSRALSAVGYVPFENLVGRVELVYFSFNRSHYKPATMRLERFGRLVR